MLLPKEHLTITWNSLLTLTSDIMPPGPFSGLLAPFIGVGRKSKKYEKLQTEDPEKKRQEATQEEINRLHSKIERLVASMSREELDLATSQDDACMVCCQARSVMQVSPCGHQALCRLCFVHNIQEAVAARDLPLKCLLCGAKIIRVKNNSKAGQGTDHPVHVGIGSRVKRMPKSVSGYSLCATSENEGPDQAKRQPSIAQSQSSYSMSSALSSMSSESGRSVRSATSARSNVSQKSGVSNSGSWFSIGSLSNFQASRIIDSKAINRPPRAHSLSSRGKNRARSSASSSSSSTLTASSSDVSIKRFVNNKDSLNNNNNQDTVSEVQLHTATDDIISHPGLYKEPRLNKSDSASLSQHQWLNSRHGSHVPLSPNSIDNRLRAIQISISHDQLNNRSYNDQDDLLAGTGHHGQSLGNTLTPIVQQPTRRGVSLGRESFRHHHQRNQIVSGCVPQNLVFRGDQQHQSPNLNIDNCFVLKSQLRRLSGSGKELQFGRSSSRYSKSPELIETTFSMSTIAEEEQELSLKNVAIE